MTQILRMQRRGLTSFQGFLADHSTVEILYLEGNSLCNFEGLGTQPHLRELHLQNNHVGSFAGMTVQRSLQVLNLAGNPISKRPLYRLMALMTVGSSLTSIDGEEVQPQEKDQATRFGRHAAIAVNCGWLLDGQPHTVEEYAAITENLKRARRATLSVAPSSTRPTTTLISPQDSPSIMRHETDAVPLLARRTASTAGPVSMSTRRASPPQAPSVIHPAVPMEATPSEAAHVISQLHVQITTLRSQLDEHRMRLQREQQTSEKLRNERAVACDVGSVGLGMDEVRAAARVEFGGGLKLTTNAVFTTSVGQTSSRSSNDESRSSRIPSAHISIDSQNVYIAHHFTRLRMGDVPLSEVKDVLLDASTVFLRLHDGTVFEVTAEDVVKAVALYKALYFFRGMLPPSVKGHAPPAPAKKPLETVEEPVAPPPKVVAPIVEAIPPTPVSTPTPVATPKAAALPFPVAAPIPKQPIVSAPLPKPVPVPAPPGANTTPGGKNPLYAPPPKPAAPPALPVISDDSDDDYKIPSSDDDDSPAPGIKNYKPVGIGGGPPLVLGGKIFGGPARRSESSDG